MIDTVKLFPRAPQQPIRSDDNLGRGIDFALVTLVFLGVGYALDRLFGTQPIMMIVFVCLALVGLTARMLFDYERKMTQLEADRAHQRNGRPTGASS